MKLTCFVVGTKSIKLIFSDPAFSADSVSPSIAPFVLAMGHCGIAVVNQSAPPPSKALSQSSKSIKLLFSNPVQHMPAKHTALLYFWMVKIADMPHSNPLHYLL
jgi:hypothetical protein